MPSIREQLDKQLDRFEELERQMSDPAVLAEGSKLAAVAREHGSLAKLATKYRRFKALVDEVAAISCGLYQGTAVLDLDYAEDSACQCDANFVLTGNGGIVEIQCTAEERSFTEDQLQRLLLLARKGIGELVALQRQAVGALA